MVFVALVATVLLLQQADPAAAVVQRATPGEPGSVVLARVLAAEKRFLRFWRNEWLRHPGQSAPLNAARVTHLHCHTEWGGERGPVHNIRSAENARSWCPSWPLGPASLGITPDDWVDAAIDPTRLDTIAGARHVLLAVLDSAAAELPGNVEVAERRARYRLDARDPDGALEAARACAGSAVRCAELLGWVRARRGEIAPAESAFAAARSAMSDQERCDWDDVRALLEDDARRDYVRLTCPQRQALSARVWWLARPLFLEPANERRVVHFARRVEVRLRSASGLDERHDWAPDHGGDALATMIQRYGWPSLEVWGGPAHDMGHTGYLAQHAFSAPPSPPYVTAEYAIGRLHMLPGWRAIEAPFFVRPDDWTLQPADPLRPGEWWPQEHYRRGRGRIEVLREFQSVLLPRGDGAVFAIATTLPAPDTAVLILSPGPDTIRQAARAAAGENGRVVLRAAVSHPLLVGVETRGGRGRAAARIRFGLAPPPALAPGMPPTVSQPLLTFAPRAGASASDEPDQAIARMLPTTRLRAGQKIGLYWETYGIAPDDSVDVQLRLQLDDHPGVVRRFANALHLAGPRHAGVTLGWREPDPGRRARRLPGPVPIQARSLVLDLSGLPRGEYWLEIAVRPSGATAARARRALSIE